MAELILLYRIRRRRIQRNQLIKTYLRDRSDPFTMPDDDFKNKFNLPKFAVKELSKELKLRFSKASAFSPEFQVLSCLHLLKSSSHLTQKDICDNDFLKMSQTTMSRYMDRVLSALFQLAPKYINFPTTANEIKKVQDEFRNVSDFTGLLGCIDCTHINIIKPPNEDSAAYLNYKQEYTINVQMVCDSKMNIIDVVARWPGSSENVFIWEMSGLRTLFKNGVIPPKSFLIGNNTYLLEPWLLTPYETPVSPAQKKFNEQHKQTSMTIKRCFSLLKSRFKCLHYGRLHYAAEKVCKIIIACCALHNICIKYDTDYNIDDLDVDVDEIDIEDIFLPEQSEELIDQSVLFRDEIALKL